MKSTGGNMGDKGKGKDGGKDKKTKATKQGNRPHEQRERDTVTKAPPGSGSR
jgi:hypothetical protein